MKLNGVIRGKIIELQSHTSFSDGQPVEVEISPRVAQEIGYAAVYNPQTDVIQAADELRRSIWERSGGNLNSTAKYVREDRDR